MKRRRYLVAYDIRSPTRLRQVHKTVKGAGDALQFSVFVCDLTMAERAGLVERLLDVTDPTEDRVAIVHIGEGGATDMFWFLGPAAPLPTDGPRIY